MKHFLVFIAWNVLLLSMANETKYCHEIFEDKHVKRISWLYLKQCLTIINGEDISKDIGENIWRLMKIAFDSLDNIPADSYKYMGYSLTFIPIKELRNISMENVDVVEAFGAIRSSLNKQHQDGFETEQLNILAQKVREEWQGKNPFTYSEYDLKSMGEILCYLNATDIENIHADAFKEAAEWIGMIEKCPKDRLQALANLAKRPEAFGEPQKWSKIDVCAQSVVTLYHIDFKSLLFQVSIIGNILNGLTASEINSIAPDKLQLNTFYTTSNTKQPSINRTRKDRKPLTPIENSTQLFETHTNKTDY
ncbi:uncharacterized protein LOC119599934 [Lucilia sericata]|uniref:uncharacterized protein LOC119599934 n=1 Tax=Lucilia sericata TaxID=13632 RepID=UPI0018A84BBB|nr:uncharacterized protein LOC119599934 [Lucilia sericata]